MFFLYINLSELQIVLEFDGKAYLDVALFTCLHVLEFVGFLFVQWCHLNPSPFLNVFFLCNEGK